MKYLITGGCGFVGSNLALEVLRRNEELFILDNLYRNGSVTNFDLLKKHGEFIHYPLDIRSTNDVETVIQEIKPDYIFHLAGQVAMTTSVTNPRFDFEINAIGTFNLLDAVRKYSPESVVLYSSTNKVYGNFENFTMEGEEWKTLMHRQEEQIVKRATGTVPEHHDAQLIAKRMREWEEEYFRFIDQDIEATNNPAELTIRQVVLDRVVTQGSRGIAGNEWHERFWSVLTTCAMQNTSVMKYLKECLATFFRFDSFPNYINLAESP